MKTVLIGAVFCAAILGQEPEVDRVSVPLTNASRPATVKVSLMNGGITVRGYEGKEVIVEARLRGGARRRSGSTARADGLRRIDNNTTGLTVEEQENNVSVGVSMMQNVDISVQVPVTTSLKLRAMNQGDIVVERVQGEIDANNLNGAVTLKNISGAVVAHALNKSVTVTFDRVTPDKAMSFSSMNGDIDVTMPADVKATLRMKSENGDIYSDFDIKLDASARKPLVEDAKGRGKYAVKFDRAMVGTVNGGGAEFQLTTFNGRIYIRKK